MATIPPVSYLELNGPHSFAEYVGDGSTTQFSIPFPYLDDAHIAVLVDDYEVEFTVLSAGTISVTPAPAVDASVVVQRRTPATLPSVSHAEGSLLRGSQLNLSTKQLLYAIQENADSGSRSQPVLDALLRTDLAGDSGSALVSFLADGTGAVARTALAKMRETVSVLDFGAVGDGVTDDTAAIQAAIDHVASIGGGAVHFLKSASYRITSALKAKNGVSLVGAAGGTVIRLDQGISSQMIFNQNQVADVPVDDFGMFDIVWNANATGSEDFAQSAVAINGVRRFRAARCVFENATGYGLAFQATDTSPSGISGPQEDIWIEDCIIRNNGFNDTGDTYDGLDFKSSSRLVIRGCTAHGNAQKGFNFRGQHINADGLIAYENGQQGIEVAGRGGASTFGAIVNITNTHSYDNALEGVSVATSAGVAGLISKVALANINSHGNGRSGIRLYESTDPDVLGQFEVSVSSSICWGNAEYGIANSVSNARSFVVAGCICNDNTLSGLFNRGNNAIFIGCVSDGNSQYGYDSLDTSLGTQLISCQLLDNGSGAIHYGGTVNAIGVGGSNSLRVHHVDAAVNYLTVEGRAAGGGPRLSPNGSDTNTELSLSSKGSGLIRLFRGLFSDEIARFSGGVGINSFFQFTSSPSGRPQVQGAGSAADVDVEFVPKGAGLVRFGVHAATADAPISGYIEIKDASGVVRKLAVLA